MDSLKVYLCGKMSGMTFEQMNEWREETTRVLEHMASFYDCIIKVVNPVDYYNFE